MIPHEKELVESLQHEPFALIGINSDRDKKVYEKRREEMGVTWRSSWQGSTGGPIPTKWNVSSWPTIYILDHQGIIRHKNIRGEPMEKAIRALVAEARK